MPEMYVPTDTRPSRFPLLVSYTVILSWLPASVAGDWCCQVLMHLEHLSSLCKNDQAAYIGLTMLPPLREWGETVGSLRRRWRRTITT